MAGVCLGVVTSGNLKLETVESLLAVSVAKPRAAEWVLLHRAGPYLDDARNELIRKFFLEAFEHCDRMLMVDSDIEFLPEDVERLADDDLPIVSGVYRSDYSGNVVPVVYEWFEQENGTRTMGPRLEWPDGPLDADYSDSPLVEVTGVGAGFLMIRRDVLATMKETYGDPCPWFAEDVFGGVHFGEDLTFCIRAAELGIPIMVDRRVEVAHHKEVRIGGRSRAVPVVS